MHKMTTAENRSRDPPYKPQVAPPQHRGGGSQNRGGFKILVKINPTEMEVVEEILDDMAMIIVSKQFKK